MKTVAGQRGFDNFFPPSDPFHAMLNKMRTRICAAQRRDTHFSKRSVCARGRSVVDDCTSLSRRDALIDRVRRTMHVDRSMCESRSRLFDDSIVRTFGRECARSSTEFQVQFLTGCLFFSKRMSEFNRSTHRGDKNRGMNTYVMTAKERRTERDVPRIIMRSQNC